MKPTLLFAAAALACTALPGLAAESFDLGGAAKGNPSTVAYKFAGEDVVAVFVRGPGDLMYAQVGDSGGESWTGWAPIGKQALKGDPSCVARTSSRIDCVGVSAGNKVYWTSYDAKANKWTGWASLGGFATSDPSIIRTSEGGPAQLRIFVRGPANHLFMNTMAGGAWSDWQDREGVTGTALSCTDMFVSGAHCYDSTGGSAQQLTDVTHNKGSDVVVENLDGAVTGKVSAVASGADGDLLRVFVHGPGNKLWVKTWDSDWSDWAMLPVAMTSAPGCATPKSGYGTWCATVKPSGAVTMTLLDDSDL